MRFSAPDPLGAGDAVFRSWSRESVPGEPSVMRFSAPEGPSPSGQGIGASVPNEASKQVGNNANGMHKDAGMALPFNSGRQCDSSTL